MTNFLEKSMNMTLTENGAVTYESTGSDCLDLFATVGGLRNAREEEVVKRFIRAYAEDPDTAMKLLFYARDVRGGLGERRVFRIIFGWMAKHHPESVRKNLEYVAEFGRYDDLLVLFGTPCEEEMTGCLRKRFEADLAALAEGRSVSLLGKWLPSVNASNRETVKNARKLAKAFGLSEAEYRKKLTALRARIRILENNLREKDYSFDYSAQPSRAMFKYQKAFIRNDGERYREFLSRVSKGEAKLHADHVAPYELVEPYLKGYTFAGVTGLKAMTPEEKQALNATWESLPDFGGRENALAVIDTSGSMYMTDHPMPAAVALSLGLYFAERNQGAFRNQFIEFSQKPQLITVKGETFVDRLEYVSSLCEVANTNLEAVFDAVLLAAVANDVKQEEMPAKLIIISDMEFDFCVEGASSTNFEAAKKKYQRYGYRLPEVIFWNVQSRNRQQPVRQNEQGVALVSGATPRLFEMIAGGNLSPYRFMMEILGGERYEKISA
ncbi:MAG: DUF2828 family protein [Lachnospiraceae bacterium]|nr:DUF2828 family protein [Lachnospiraceae bacterium]